MQNHLRTPQVLYLVVLLCVMCVNTALIVRVARPYEADGANQSGAAAGDVAEGNGDLGDQRQEVNEDENNYDESLTMFGQELKLHWNCDTCRGGKNNCWYYGS
ncbi:hypothetical protein KP509_11G028000 [Ceratopteris richardii]|uniref:Uncharacterized protein n=1 Tax=Ceratopteris richardii TaxID=49495 RepID=A0A8T2TWH0_CERRI|nr:hypothetical protein KP509_11G028000 [Ceratopteris richardii]